MAAQYGNMDGKGLVKDPRRAPSGYSRFAKSGIGVIVITAALEAADMRTQIHDASTREHGMVHEGKRENTTIMSALESQLGVLQREGLGDSLWPTAYCKGESHLHLRAMKRIH